MNVFEKACMYRCMYLVGIVLAIPDKWGQLQKPLPMCNGFPQSCCVVSGHATTTTRVSDVTERPIGSIFYYSRVNRRLLTWKSHLNLSGVHVHQCQLSLLRLTTKSRSQRRQIQQNSWVVSCSKIAVWWQNSQRCDSRKGFRQIS